MYQKLIILIVIILTGCTTLHPKPGTDLLEVYPDLSHSQSFAFLYEGDRYFFSPGNFEKDGKKCYVFLGFKNNKLAYSLNPNIYYDKIRRNKNKMETVRSIQSKLVNELRKSPYSSDRCFETKKARWRSSPGDGQAVLIILAPLAFPFMVPDIIKDSRIRSIQKKIFEQAKLGKSKNYFPDFITKKWIKKKDRSLSYYQYEYRKMITNFYFEDGKLSAWSQSRYP